MRFTEYIGSQDDWIERHSIHPRYYPCPHCGKKGKRKDVVTRTIADVGPLHRRSWIVADVGVYQARCSCCRFFQAAIPGVPRQGRYSLEVRNSVANALIRDRLPYRLVQQRMQEDFLLNLSLGYIHDCFLWAHAQIDLSACNAQAGREEHWQFVLTCFSGLLCIDEVHDSGRTILFATDPLNDFTVAFRLVEKNDQMAMNAFLEMLCGRGLKVRVAITDGSPLYKESLKSYLSATGRLEGDPTSTVHLPRDQGGERADPFGGTRRQGPHPTPGEQGTQAAPGASQQES